MDTAGENRGASRRGGHHRAGGGGCDTRTAFTGLGLSISPILHCVHGVAYADWDANPCPVCQPIPYADIALRRAYQRAHRIARAPSELSDSDLPGSAAEPDAAPSQPADSQPGA